MPAGQCPYLKPDGSRCRAHPRHGSKFCYFHCPAIAADRDAARKAGGVARSRRAAVLPADTPDRVLNSAADVGRLVADTINGALRGEIDSRIANNVGYLAGIILKTIDRTAVEQRLARLEKIVASQGVITDSCPIEIVGRQGQQ